MKTQIQTVSDRFSDTWRALANCVGHGLAACAALVGLGFSLVSLLSSAGVVGAAKAHDYLGQEIKTVLPNKIAFRKTNEEETFGF